MCKHCLWVMQQHTWSCCPSAIHDKCKVAEQLNCAAAAHICILAAQVQAYLGIRLLHVFKGSLAAVARQHASAQLSPDQTNRGIDSNLVAVCSSYLAFANLTERHVVNVNLANITTASQFNNIFFCGKSIRVFSKNHNPDYCLHHTWSPAFRPFCLFELYRQRSWNKRWMLL